MADTPSDLKYAKSHEWVRLEGDEATVGITDHAQRALNDIVYLELPAVGASFDQGDEFGVVESVKSVSEVYAPLGGDVVAVNEALEDSPEMVNKDPYGEGWLVRIRVRDPTESGELLSAGEYADLVEE